MKKLFAVLLVLVMAFAIAGCTSEKSEEKSNAIKGQAEPPVGVFQEIVG